MTYGIFGTVLTYSSPFFCFPAGRVLLGAGGPMSYTLVRSVEVLILALQKSSAMLTDSCALLA